MANSSLQFEMANSSSDNTGSGSSSHNSAANRGRSRVAGIPKKCWCGCVIIEIMSTSVDNPYRRYYRCLFAYTNKLRHDPHVFKWVDEAYRNEIEQLDYQVGVLENELQLVKASCVVQTSHGDDPPEFVTEDVLNEFEVSFLGNVEDVMAESMKKMKRMMALVFGSCVLVVVIGLVMKK